MRTSSNFYRFTLLFPLFSSLVAFEGSRPFEVSESIKQPTTQKEAVEFKERYEKTREEFDNELRKKESFRDESAKIESLLKDKKAEFLKVDASRQEEIINQINKLEFMQEANKILAEPQVRALIDQATQAMGTLYESVPTQEEIGRKQITTLGDLPADEATLWQKLTIWFNENKIKFYQLIGNTAKVIELRKNLDRIYQDLGLETLGAKARNSRELARLLQDLAEKIDHHRTALNSYQIALNAGGEGQTLSIQNEVKQIASDLIQLREELSFEDAKTSKLSEQINKDINLAFKTIGLSDTDAKKIQDSALDAHKKEITNLRDSIQSRVEDAKRWLFLADKGSVANLRQFVADVATLSKKNVQNFSFEEQIAIKGLVHNTFAEIMFDLISSLYNPNARAADRIRATNYLLDFSNSYMNAAREFSNLYVAYLIKEAQQGAPIAGQLPATYTATLVQQLKPIMQAYRSMVQRGQESGQIFNNYVKAVEQFEQVLRNAPVDKTSLEATQKLRDSVQNVQNNLVQTSKNRPLTKLETDAVATLIEKNNDLALQQVLQQTAPIAENGSLQIPAPPPVPPRQTVADAIKKSDQKLTTAKKNIEKTQPTDQNSARTELLNQIANRNIILKKSADRKLAPEQQKPTTLADTLSAAMEKRRTVIIRDDEIEESTTYDPDWD